MLAKTIKLSLQPFWHKLPDKNNNKYYKLVKSSVEDIEQFIIFSVNCSILLFHHIYRLASSLTNSSTILHCNQSIIIKRLIIQRLTMKVAPNRNTRSPVHPFDLFCLQTSINDITRQYTFNIINDTILFQNTFNVKLHKLLMSYTKYDRIIQLAYW